MDFDKLAIAHYFSPRRPLPTPSWSEVLDARQVRLESLARAFVEALYAAKLGAIEGTVRSQQDEAPYRRFDCDHRALLYLRLRPKKDLVRIDIAGHWLAPPRTRLTLGSSRGVLVLKTPSDVATAVEVVARTVADTREARVNRTKLH